MTLKSLGYIILLGYLSSEKTLVVWVPLWIIRPCLLGNSLAE